MKVGGALHGLLLLSSVGCSGAGTDQDGGVDASNVTDGGVDVAASDAGLEAGLFDAEPQEAASDGGCVGAATVKGTIRGITFDAKDAISAYAGPNEQGLEIVDFVGLCPEQNNIRPSSNYLAFVFNGVSAFTPGTYTFDQGLSLEFYSFDQTCEAPVGDVGGEGGVFITSVDDCGIHGSFDLNFSSESHISGTFDAPTCVIAPTDAGSGCE